MRLTKYLLLLASMLLAAGCEASKPDADPSSSRESETAATVANSEQTGQEARSNDPAASTDQSSATPVQISGVGEVPDDAIAEPNSLLPMAEILAIAQSRVAGEVIEVELEEDDGQPEYEVEILTPSGRKIEIDIDATTGIVLEIEED